MKPLAIPVCLAILLLPSLAFGQAETTGRIACRVVDEAGNPVAAARVTLISPVLQGDRVTRTDDNGEFLAALLPVGPYAVSVAAPGRQTVQVSLRVGVAQTAPLAIVMIPGDDLVESITVRAAATPLETTVVGENFDYETKVEELPIAVRNVLEVSSYAPNVQQGPWAPDVLVGADLGLVVSGAPPYSTIVQLEGTDISDSLFGQGLVLYLEDAIEDIQVMTSGIPARYGRFEGGVINTITRTGGNELDGTVRAELSKESWNSTTPFGEEQSGDLNQIYQATLGGYMLKDRLWFFAGARSVPTRTRSGTTILTGESYQGETNDTRWQFKLRGAPSVDHVIEATYLERDFETTGLGGVLYGDLLAATEYYNLEPMSLATLAYQGVLGPTSFLEARVARKRHATNCCSRGAFRSHFWDRFQGGVYNNQEGDPADVWRRDSDNASVAYTRLFGGSGPGSHTFEAGAQFVRSMTAGEPVPSPTGFALFASPFGTPFAEVDAATGEVRYNLGDEVGGQRVQEIPVDAKEAVVDNFALYAQDSWQLGKWRFDLGLRWDRYDASTYRDDLKRSPDALAPRIGVTRNISPTWQVQATWGRYVAKFADMLLSHTAGVRNWSVVSRGYTGPALTDVTADDLEAVLRDDALWTDVIGVSDPGQPTAFLAEDIELPYTDEFTIGVRAGLPRGAGSVTATFIDRDYRNLLEDFVGDYGAQSIVDPLDPATGEPLVIDNVVWDNASGADRRYRALAATWDYRPGPRWNVGGNWTWSRLTGNQDQRSLLFRTPIGTYERSRPQEAAVPDGYLADDVRHRLQAWGGYRFGLGRVGALVLGGTGRFQSGGNWSRAAWLPLAEDPGYNNEVGQFYLHHFDGRGNNGFDDWWTIDLSARWQFRIFKQLDGWLKMTVINVFDNDAVIAYDTRGFAADDGMGGLAWEPLGNCGPGDAPSADCTDFGRIRNQNDYQRPRGYWFTVGLAF